MNGESRLFRGRVVVAMDHALGIGHVAPLDRPKKLLDRILEGKPDGMILTPGLAKLLPDTGLDLSWFMTADYFATSTLPGQSGDTTIHGPVFSLERAGSAGAIGVKVLLVFGRKSGRDHLANVQFVSKLIEDGRREGMQVMVESVLWGEAAKTGDRNRADLVVHAARIAFELGADLIKIPIPEPIDVLADLTAALPVPIYLMGGPASDVGKLFSQVRTAIHSGVHGVAFGRNVWTHSDPVRYLHALRGICDDGLDPVEAMEFIDGTKKL